MDPHMDQRASATVALRQTFGSPRVFAFASAGAEALCAKNGFSFVELLRPFGRVPQKATVELEKTARHLTGVTVDYVGKDETRLTDDALAVALNARVLRFTSEEPYGGMYVRDREGVSEFLASVRRRGVELSPWFDDFATHAALRIGSVAHETLGHPVACVVAISSMVDDAVQAMKETFESIRGTIRTLFPDGLAPASLQAQFVLLHDDHEGPTQVALDKLRQLQVPFGIQHCHLVKINSLDALSPTAALGGAESFLSPSDCTGLEEFAKHVCVAMVIPKLLETLQTSSRLLDSKKKTFSDTLATWWGGSKKPAAGDEPPASGNLKHAPQSVVMLYRRVGDCAFMLQCYELAHSAYKACAKEVKRTTDEWLAGAVEMSVIAAFMQTTLPPRDYEADMERAIKLYQQVPGMARFVLRCSIAAGALCKASGNFVRAGGFYADCSDAAPHALTAALLQEQASLCLLFMDPPRFRRLAFRLVFAARKFVTARLVPHALRCYRFAEHIYQDHEWQLIDDHVRYALGRQLSATGRFGDALPFFVELLRHAGDAASKERQASYLREYFHLVGVLPPGAGAWHGAHTLPLSLLRAEGPTPAVRLWAGGTEAPSSTSGGRGAGGGKRDDDGAETAQWERWETELQTFGTKAHRRSMSVALKSNRAHDCAVGEPATLEVRLHNPLALPLHLGAVSVLVQYERVGAGGPIVATEEHVECAAHADVMLAPGQTQVLVFLLIPRAPGMLRVRGLLCFPFGQRPGLVVSIEPPRLRLNRSARERQGVFYEPSKQLDLAVCGPMPLMEMEVSGAPAHMLAGQLARCVLTLANVGKTDMRAMRVKMSHPAFFKLGDDDDTSSSSLDNALRDHSIWEVPTPSLGPGASVQIPFWLRAATTGSHALCLLVHYEPSKRGSIESRVHRHVLHVVVHPSLRVAARSWPFPGSVISYVIAVTVTNVCKDTLVVDALGCGSFEWAASALPDLCRPGRLPSGHSSHLVFRVTPTAHGAFALHCALGLESALQQSRVLLALLERDKSERLFERLMLMGVAIEGGNTTTTTTTAAATATANASNASAPAAAERLLFRQDALQLAVLWHLEHATQGERGFLCVLDLPVGGRSEGEGRVRAASPLETTSSASGASASSTTSPAASTTTPTTGAVGATERLPLRYALTLPRRVRHSFSSNQLCVVAGVLDLFNPTSVPCVAQLTLHPPSGALHARAAYFWAGLTSHSITLGPRCSASVPVRVGFCAPGMFVVHRYQVTVTPQVGDSYVLAAEEQVMVEVLDAPELAPPAGHAEVVDAHALGVRSPLSSPDLVIPVDDTPAAAQVVPTFNAHEDVAASVNSPSISPALDALIAPGDDAFPALDLPGEGFAADSNNGH